MTTTQRFSRVDYARVGRKIAEEWLSARAETLPKAANGQTIAPSCRRAAQILKDMEQGKARAFEHLVATGVTNIVDGVPFERATSALRVLMSFLEHVHTQRHTVKPRGSFGALVGAENRIHARTMGAAILVLETPASAPALLTVMHNCDNELAKLADVRAAAEYKLTEVEARPRHLVVSA